MGILSRLKRPIKRQIDRAPILPKAKDIYDPFPLTQKEISESKVLMKFYRYGYLDGKESKQRKDLKTHLFQQAYDYGLLEGERDA
jgi:hypothetical protein